MGAQEPEAAERARALRGRPARGRRRHLEPRRATARSRTSSSPPRCRRVDGEPRDLVRRGASAATVASPSPRRIASASLAMPAAVAVHALEHDDALPGARRPDPTMSPSTAPASIEVSCPGSPTRISRASGRTASTSRAISDSETIEVSSTITTSCGSRLPRSWRSGCGSRAASRAGGAASRRAGRAAARGSPR